MATPEAFARDPDLVYRFYNERRHYLEDSDVHPNAGHMALADLANAFTGELVLVTQNVDDLHERAGGPAPMHMHGELAQMRCQLSGDVFPAPDYYDRTTPCPCCEQAGNLRPNVVWFGEMPFYMELIYEHLERCDLFVAIGTSGTVYPAAGFVATARQAGAHTLQINPEPTENGSLFAEHWQGPATTEVPRFRDWLLASKVHD